MEIAEEEFAQAIFAPQEVTERFALKEKKLIHYCSAETAMRIIGNGEFWMRNVRVMNDMMEVEHGFQLLANSIKPHSQGSTLDHGLRAVTEALDEIFYGIGQQSIALFDQRLDALRHHTYITCLSDIPPQESNFGRLSMWRNYSGGGKRV